MQIRLITISLTNIYGVWLYNHQPHCNKYATIITLTKLQIFRIDNNLRKIRILQFLMIFLQKKWRKNLHNSKLGRNFALLFKGSTLKVEEIR